MMNKLKLLAYTVIIMSLNCTNKFPQESIIPLTRLNKTDTIEAGNEIVLSKENSSHINRTFIFHRVEYFLVKDYPQNQKARQIDSFIANNKNPEFKKYDSYEMIFIRESNDTSEEKINSKPEIFNTPDFGVHKDVIFIYDWEKGSFNGMLQFENGNVVSSTKK